MNKMIEFVKALIPITRDIALINARLDRIDELLHKHSELLLNKRLNQQTKD